MGGKFFPYKIIPEVYHIFEIPLTEMQIVSDLIDEKTGKLNKMFSDNCLVYSLKQFKLPKEIIDVVKIKCPNRYVNKKHLKESF